MGISSYSTTPGSNTAINGINIAEGCAPSGINDAIRQMMADIASGVQLAQAPTATGTANAIVVTLSPVITSYFGGQRITFIPASDNTGATTINYGGGVINFQKWGGISLVATDIVSGVAADVLHDGTRAILMNPQTYTQGANIASAGTINLDTATGDYVHITGATTIAAITLKQGRQRTIVFDGALTFTNGASLILPGSANITTAAGDAAVVRGEASGVVRVVNYIKASGQAIVASTTYTNGSGISITGSVIDAASTYRTFSSADNIATTDNGAVLEFTGSSNTTLTTTAAATLTSKFSCRIHNNGTANLTIDPNAAELIDSLATLIMYPGEIRDLSCTGSALTSKVVKEFVATFTASGTFTLPPGYKKINVEVWGGGASGATAATNGGGGGGGGAYISSILASSAITSPVTVTIGAGGAAILTAATSGNAGGTTTFGTYLTAYGGGGGGGVSGGGGGGGGSIGYYKAGSTAAFQSGVGGSSTTSSPGGGGVCYDQQASPAAGVSAASMFGGATGSSSGSSSTVGGGAYYGGGGGGLGSAGATGVGGQSFAGGGGGGGAAAAGNAAGGASIIGGNGGAGATGSANATDGVQPSGGGGGAVTGHSGKGGDGQVVITGVA